MKKLYRLLFLVLALTFVFAGLAQAETIHLLMEGVPDTFIIQDLLPEFERETGITVEFEVVNYAQMHAKLLPQLMAREGAYDAIVVDNYWAGEFPAGGWLEPLDDLAKKSRKIDLDKYVPSMLSMVGYYQGTLYMIPFYNYTMVLCYREDMMNDPQLKKDYRSEYGRNLKIPDNLKDYVNLCSFMTMDSGKYGKIYGASMMGLKPDPICMEWSNYLFSMGGDYYDKNWKSIINNSAGIQASTLYVKNITENAPPGAPGYGFDEALQLFYQGKAFSIVTFWMFYVEMMDPAKSEVAGKVGLSPMPGGANLNGGWGWAIPNSSPNKEAAWKFIEWVESFPIAKKRALAGGAPTRTDVFLDRDVVAKYPHYPAVYEILKTAKPVPEFTYSAQMIEVVGRELSLMIGGKSVPKGLDTAAKELDKLAKQARLQ